MVWKGGVVREGEVLRIPGWGMPIRGGGLGDLRLVCRLDCHSESHQSKQSNQSWSEDQLKALKSVWPEWKEPVETGESVILGV